MFSRRRLLQLPVLALMLVWGPSAGLAEPTVRAVATFSILGDMVANVGGDRVSVTTLVGPDGDAHVYQPTPADARAVGSAQIAFVNGLGFEGWLDRLIRSAGFSGPVIVTTKGIAPLVSSEQQEPSHHHDDHDHGQSAGGHDHGDIDPHAWQNLTNARIYVRNIADGLSAVDPAGEAAYRANADRYLAKISELDTQVRTTIAALPPERRRIVTSHDAFGYFANAYGVEFLSPAGVNMESEPSAADVARLIRTIREDKIPAVFMENITDPRLIEQIRRETGATLGGTLYSDALSPANGPAPTYLEMFRHNLTTLMQALSS